MFFLQDPQHKADLSTKGRQNCDPSAKALSRGYNPKNNKQYTGTRSPNPNPKPQLEHSIVDLEAPN